MISETGYKTWAEYLAKNPGAGHPELPDPGLAVQARADQLAQMRYDRYRASNTDAGLAYLAGSDHYIGTPAPGVALPSVVAAAAASNETINAPPAAVTAPPASTYTDPGPAAAPAIPPALLRVALGIAAAYLLGVGL